MKQDHKLNTNTSLAHWKTINVNNQDGRIDVLYEKLEDTKGVIRIRISKKNSQHNGQKKEDKQ